MCISAHTSTAGAILLDMGSKRLTLPEENNTFAWVVFWFFFGSAVLVWFFSGHHRHCFVVYSRERTTRDTTF
jgi:hypothetical protein